MNKCTAFRLTKIFLSLASLVHGFRGATPSAWHLSSSLLSSTSTTKVTEAMMPATGTSRIVCRDDGVVLVPMKPFHLRDSSSPSRRAFLQSGTMLTPLLWHPMACRGAAQREPLPELLYRILRVREATVQETRLIKSGKFKDVQRANVKLAVKFMIDNYRLNDAFVGASVYLDGGSQRRVDAGQVGQRSVQNLYTILEYFDSADVENLKVNSLAGKEDLVLKGLDATRRSIDEFLAYFPKSEVDSVITRINEENELNAKEFDPVFGTILNMPSTSTAL